jgi:hypothetical protein
MIAILHHTKRPEHLPVLLSKIPLGVINGPHIIIASGYITVPFWQTRISNEGQTRALWSAFSYFIHATEEPFLYVLEDDVIPCVNAFQYMKKAIDGGACDNLAWLSWFDVETAGPYNYKMPTIKTRTARFEFEKGSFKRFHGNSCFTIPRLTVEKLLQYDVEGYIRDFRRLHAGDLVMTEAMPNAKVGWHVPSLVRHVGLVSTWFPGERPALGFETPSYKGDDFDALSLL